MARALAITLVIKPSTAFSAAYGPQEAMAEVKALLVGGSVTVYTDGASSQFVAVPANEANPHESGI